MFDDESGGSDPEQISFESVSYLVGAHISPAELHGLMCGELCSPDLLDDDEMAARLMTWIADEIDYDNFDQIVDVFRISAGLIGSDDLRFQLLLPDDELELKERTAALRRWCVGFLGTFRCDEDALSEDGEDAIKTYMRLIEMGDELIDLDDGDEDENERDFVEISEFVRVSVMVLYEEMRGGGSE